jgi:dimeric dUTPase (all-alpha-NTP-PPase superfamily)
MDIYADKFEQLFAMQAKLNDHAFRKQGITMNDGSLVTMQKLHDHAVTCDSHTANSETNEWVTKYIMGLESELREIKDELKWKWWSAGKINVEALQMEIVDAMHFLVSAAIASGMNAEQFMEKYVAKNAVNIARQDDGYIARNERPEA